ncbi:V-set and immunoglobulin domain-containing protein 1 isoform X1 [Pleuronectes platessa]|uniref:V-set and immunoglobulin domain-containing protein 1 isoform X1 n=1 Tax=Pleuronectes platessa TaxID=8262 RepID=UPI00232A3CA9|nr:V-set and immunoglobulin domain-containing protein 1 isoform X1 [Pleuronectes platessa]
MLLSWFIVFLCISANTGDVLLLRKPGENVTLQCSFAECVSSIDGCVGMYLYHGLNPEKEVLYYHYSEKVTPRKRYSQRVEKNGSLGNHTLTISNLVAEDSGLYRCDYKRTTETDVKCTGYILVVSEPTSRPEEEHQPHVDEKCPPLVWVAVATCAISIFATIIFVLLILKLKQWTRSRRTAGSVPIECVYEVMTKNRIVPEAAPEVFSPNTYDFA